MDPDEALAKMRDLTSRYGHEDHGNDEDHDIALRMVEVFQGLDEWLTNGGFPPSAWGYELDPADLDGG